MKKTAQMIVLTIVICVNVLSKNPLKLVKTLGDQRDNYIFYKIHGAVMSRTKNIYVLDAHEYTISMYDWSGKFKKRIGHKGRGPGDFYLASNLHYAGNHIHLFDKGNARMVKISPDLEQLKYSRLLESTRFLNQCFALGNDSFIGPLYPKNLESKRIAVVNEDGKRIRDFFSEYPVKIDSLSIDRSKKHFAQMHRLRIGIETIPKIGRDKDGKKVLVSFFKPDNPIIFYVYGVDDGKLLNRFEYDIPDSRYRFFRFNIEASWDDIANRKKLPKHYAYPLIQSLYIYKNHYIAVLKLLDYHKKELLHTETSLLVFEPGGNLLFKKKIASDMKVYSISREGYVVGSRLEEPVSKIYIFSLTL